MVRDRVLSLSLAVRVGVVPNMSVWDSSLRPLRKAFENMSKAILNQMM